MVDGLVSAALYAWGRWVAARHGGRWRYVAWAPLLAFALHTLGLLFTVAGLVHAFDAVADVDAAHKAQHLADGIALAMRATAILAPPATLLYVGSILAFLVGTVRRPASAPPPSTAGPSDPA